jgi:GNAT superfamily N-acetyltransferase
MSVSAASIRRLSIDDLPVILDIINAAAKKYGGVIPADCYHEPYMPGAELAREISRMTFYGFVENDSIAGVAGFQPVADVTLIRHAYVRPEHQRKGIGARLLDHIKNLTRTRHLLVGTWAAAQWAVDFYRKQGFTLLPDKDDLLARYWKIPARQTETSIVLGLELEEQ